MATLQFRRANQERAGGVRTPPTSPSDFGATQRPSFFGSASRRHVAATPDQGRGLSADDLTSHQQGGLFGAQGGGMQSTPYTAVRGGGGRPGVTFFSPPQSAMSMSGMREGGRSGGGGGGNGGGRGVLVGGGGLAGYGSFDDNEKEAATPKTPANIPASTVKHRHAGMSGSQVMLDSTFSTSKKYRSEHRSSHIAAAKREARRVTSARSSFQSELDSSWQEEEQEEGNERTREIVARSVVVFGFPPDYTERVRLLFERCGEVEQCTVEKYGANHFSVLYRTADAAQLALSKHGMKVDNILIGVMPCMNVEVFSSFREEGEDRGLDSSLPLTESSSYRGWASGQRREGGLMVEDEPLQEDIFVKKPAMEDGCFAKILNYLFGV